MFKNNLFIIIALTVGIATFNSNTHSNNTNYGIMINSDMRNNPTSDYIVDTNGIAEFWNTFRNCLRENRIKNINSYLSFPIRAFHLVEFQYALDCNADKYNIDLEKYLDVMIDSTNFNQYYSFVFSDSLLEMIQRTDIELLINSPHVQMTDNSLTYLFFPKEYFDLNCKSDISLNFHFYRKVNSWKIHITGIQ